MLTAEEAAKFTVENVLGGTDSWLPTEECVVLEAPVVSFDGSTLSWTANDDARCYVVFKNGQYLTNQTATTLAISEEGVYSVRAANEKGGMGNMSTTVAVKRTIAAGKWSTIVVPFDMSASQIATAFGSGTKVAQLTGFENGELQFTTASSINANEPCLIKVASDFTSAAVSGVNIVEGTPEKTNIEGVDFIGSYAATIDIPASDASNSYYFISNSQLYKTAASGTDNTLKALRAYFEGPARLLQGGPDRRESCADLHRRRRRDSNQKPHPSPLPGRGSLVRPAGTPHQPASEGPVHREWQEGRDKITQLPHKL